ncbi:putative ATP-dependent RNA helicase DDX4 isoform X4 [Ascaphus truei]|uniref:putative ATP-dependent RNA helicase DDX4 isoform X4 n=1 Tax=Ascaphus truei TaxID=8439 RepID=UPI003F59D0E3
MADEDWEAELEATPSFVPDNKSFKLEPVENPDRNTNTCNRSERGSFGRGFDATEDVQEPTGFSGKGGYNANEDGQKRSMFPRRDVFGGKEQGLQHTGFSGRGGFKDGNSDLGSQTRGRGGRGAFGAKRDENGGKPQESGGMFSSRRGGFLKSGGGDDGSSRRDFGGKGLNNGNSDFDSQSRGEGRGGRGAFGAKSDDKSFGSRDFGGKGGQEGNDDKGENREGPKVTYIPPPPPDTEDAIFAHHQSGINFNKYDDILVEVKGPNVPPAIMSIDEANLCDTLNKNISRAGYVKLTPVQRYSIPIILAGRDLMACAQTGSGKTAAFLLPILAHMMNTGVTASHFKEQQEPEAIIIAPTRELINQIFLDALKFSYGTCVRPVVIYGGTQTGHSIREIIKGCNILCATPGRLIDIIEREKIGLSKLQYLVLDEADRMLDMGFLPDITRFMASRGMPTKEQRQTLLFSATFPEKIKSLSRDYLKSDSLFVAVGQGGACSDVEQTIIQVEEFSKKDKLINILQNIGKERTMVFVKTKKKADFIATILCQEAIPTTSIHGDREQREREIALSDFRSGKCPVLVATSVAARGLDIQNVQHVINYDLPKDIDEYVHRIGRTGRCGNLGKAISFLDLTKSDDTNIARPLVKVLSDAQQEVPAWLEEVAFGAHGTSSYNPGGNVFASVDTRETGGARENTLTTPGFSKAPCAADEEVWGDE